MYALASPLQSLTFTRIRRAFFDFGRIPYFEDQLASIIVLDAD